MTTAIPDPPAVPTKIALRTPLVMVLALLLLAAILMRAADFIRLDYAAWWDGVGWGYSDGVWIASALHLADGDFSALKFRTEGLMFIPVQALLFKVFGIELGFHVWAWFLVATSALVVPIAAHTVFLATGRLLGAMVTGTFVIFDPVASWFGLNGWADGQTMIAIAVVCWAFVFCARRATLPRQLMLAIALSVLALGHATWTYPATAWAVLAWPLLATRKRWFPRALSLSSGSAASSFGWTRTLPVPVLFLAIVVVTILSISSFDRDSESGLGLGALSGDTNNQRALVVTYDPSVKWNDWQPRDTIRVVFTKFLPRFTDLLPALIHGHIGNVIPLYRWLLAVIAVAVFVIVLSRWRHPWPSLTGLIAVPVTAVLFRSQLALNEPTVMLSYVVFALAFAYVPLARVLTLLFIPFLTLMTLYLPLLTQPRHTNALVFFVLLIAGITVGFALDRVTGWRGRSSQGKARSIQVAIASMALVILVASGASQFAGAVEGRSAEARYLKWLATRFDDKSMLLTSGDVDPWEVRHLTGATVLYDAENGGRLVLTAEADFLEFFDATGGEERWGSPISKVPGVGFGGKAWGTTTGMFFEGHDSTVELFDELRASGRQLWFYSPWDGFQPTSFAPNIIYETRQTEFQLDSVATYPGQLGRGALLVRQPLTFPSD